MRDLVLANPPLVHESQRSPAAQVPRSVLCCVLRWISSCMNGQSPRRLEVLRATSTAGNDRPHTEPVWRIRRVRAQWAFGAERAVGDAARTGPRGIRQRSVQGIRRQGAPAPPAAELRDTLSAVGHAAHVLCAVLGGQRGGNAACW